MKLRVFTEPQQGASYDDLLRVAQATEALRYDAFFRSDHYMRIGDGDPLPGPSDAWLTLGALARETKRVKLGALVSPITFRHPGVLAISVANVANMSGGRAELGIGAGWYPTEHAAYGIAFPDVGERFARLEEQLAIITGLWDTPAGETFNFDGTHYQVVDSPALPKPVTRPRIIMGGGGAKRTPRLAATYADEFNFAFTSPEIAKIAFDRVREASSARGRALELSMALTVCVGGSNADVERRAAFLGQSVESLRQNGLAGTAGEAVDRIGRFAELGVTTVYLQLMDLSDTRQLEFVSAAIVPQLSR